MQYFYIRKLEDEEESYKFTNAFTSAGEGSVLDISKRYRQLQHNMRASAVRASKKLYKDSAKTFFCSQTMVSMYVHNCVELNVYSSKIGCLKIVSEIRTCIHTYIYMNSTILVHTY